MKINTHQETLDLLLGPGCLVCRFPLVIEQIRLPVGVGDMHRRVSVEPIATVGYGPRLVWRDCRTKEEEPILISRTCDAVLAVMCPELPQLSEGLVQHTYLFVVRSDGSQGSTYAVTYDSRMLLCPYGAVFTQDNPLTPQLARWFDAGMKRMHDPAERSTDPWTLIP